MNINDYIKTLSRETRESREARNVVVDELCPACKGKLAIHAPCCTSKNKTKLCTRCGWKAYI